MTVDETCPICEDKGIIECPCCSGQGGYGRNLHPMSMIKGYMCSYCTGMGKIHCPQCIEPRLVIREKAGVFFSELFNKLLPEKNLL